MTVALTEAHASSKQYAGDGHDVLPWYWARGTLAQAGSVRDATMALVALLHQGAWPMADAAARLA